MTGRSTSAPRNTTRFSSALQQRAPSAWCRAPTGSGRSRSACAPNSGGIIDGMSDQDAVSLTRRLLQFDTINPPGKERDCAKHAGALLQDWGFDVQYFEYAEGRTSVVARAGGSDNKAPLCLTGH